jgi:carbon-monoxide dehydrogenase medium subunit
MIPAEFDYVAPESLDEALAALKEGGEDAKLLAGGHSLLPLMKLRLAAPTLLVDLRRVPGLSGIDGSNGGWKIGAMTSHSAIARGEGLGLVAKVASTIADPQVRHRGTIGGSLAHGDPASDQLAILLAYEGSVVVRGASGEREIAAADLFQDYLTTAVKDDEVLTEVRFPALEGYGFAYEKFNRRQEDWAMVAVSAMVKKAGDGSCEDVRIGLTHMANVPLRATAAEQALRGRPLEPASIADAAEQAAEGTEPPGDLNASPEYKRHLARVLCRRALEEAAA